MVGNKKIKNATEVVQNNIKFKSKLEAMIYRTLVELGYAVQHEEHTFLLWEGFKPTIPFYTWNRRKKTVENTDRKLINTTYTPDFYFEYRGIKVLIEAKGIANDVFPYKFKMFRKCLEQREDKDDYFISIVYTKKQLLEVLKKLEEYADFRQNQKTSR